MAAELLPLVLHAEVRMHGRGKRECACAACLFFPSFLSTQLRYKRAKKLYDAWSGKRWGGRSYYMQHPIEERHPSIVMDYEAIKAAYERLEQRRRQLLEQVLE